MMDRLTEFAIHNVRCFEGNQHGCLKPITLLVGENSTGKTTFLGCYEVLGRLFSNARRGGFYYGQADFNVEPFSMGSFRDIARARGGRGGSVNEFKLGMTFDINGKGQQSCHILVTFAEDESQPAVSSLRFRFDEDRYLELKQTAKEKTVLSIPGQEEEINGPIGHALMLVEHMVLYEQRHLFEEKLPRPITQYISGLFAHNKHPQSWRSRSFMPDLRSSIAIAPLRSEPKRTYDPVREMASPSGGHVPMLMMRLERKDEKHWKSLHDSLVAFGKGSGLFRDIKVKRHGRQMSDPFQLQVKVQSGRYANIMDVGYGVSQSLPILVDVLSKSKSRNSPVFLLQQPEVHLHPRGQAELAGLFVRAFKRHGSHFLVETHSDYIIDRIRISVKKGIIKAEYVSILYFEPSRNAVKIHNITVDEDGNLENAPEGYRNFFIDETDELLGFDN